MASAFLHLTVLSLLFSAAASYTNHTVGGGSGWFFNVNANTSAANYSTWASTQTFNLGDYLIFKTNSNQTVIQTYNDTIFKSCNTDDAPDEDYFQYGGGSEGFGQSLTIAVPLTIQGPNYFLSDAADGTQCANGMSFAIDVKHGQGLPPSLNQPPPPPYREPPGADSAESPRTVVIEGSQPSDNGAFRGCADFQILFPPLVLALWAMVI